MGFWQCVDDPDVSLEVKRFEDYFIISARHGAEQYRRDGRFDNDVLSVGANTAGRPMALELNEGKVTCTNPPNFCVCNGAYKKVKSPVKPAKSTAIPLKDNVPGSTKAVPDQGAVTSPQIILERDPLNFQLVNGGTVLLFDDNKNEDNEKRMFDWPKLTYYYLPQLVLAGLSNGDFAEVRQLNDEVYVFFQLTVQRIDKYELMERIDESINTKILPNLVLPLSYQKMTVEIAGSRTTPAVLAGADSVFDNGTFEISLRVLSQATSNTVENLKLGQEIANAINSGLSDPTASIEIIQKTQNAKTNEAAQEQVTKQWQIIRSPLSR